MRRVANAESCKWLVSFLEKIPNFRLKLTEEEKSLIGESGNILAIGRSGTGKTTCALLRLFATEILFKVQSNYAKSGILKDTRFKATDVDISCGLHTIFVTASPVLTNEVRRYYEKLNDKIKHELILKDKKKKEEASANNPIVIVEKPNAPDNKMEEMKIPGSIEKIKTSNLPSSISGEEEEDQTTLGQSLKRMEEISDNDQDLELIDESELEKQLSLPHSLMSIPDEHFPLFLTLRRFILMVDAVLHRPFFARSIKGNIIGIDKNAEWHNENTGVMMINSYYKYNEQERTACEQINQDDPDKLVDLIEKEEEEDQQINVEDMDDEDEQGLLREEKKNKKKLIKTHFMGKEVDFEIFSKKFWPTIKGQVQAMNATQSMKVNPASVWKEICTHIKGAADAYEYVGHYIPLTKYQALTSDQNVFDEYMQGLIYNIFYKYERWSYENNYYDMSDVVNHLLEQIKWYGYHGQPIHFIMCDEVQDLTPATLLLLLKVAEQTLFFSGDTAQTIAQGVSFRFADLKSLFYYVRLPSGMPSIMQLTINFRSHARILDLANSVIRVIELLFPSSIDKLKKEKSSIDGLKPVVLDSELQETLFNMLVGNQKALPTSSESLLARPPLEFGCDQVILVRNQQAKERLPSFLKHALCLTIYEAKGLEFDDVILYNFFTDSETKEDWRILKSLVVESVKVPKKLPEGDFKQSFDQLTVKPWQMPEEYKNLPEGEYEIVKNVDCKGKAALTEGRFSGICVELKHLYTAITRPRKRLIIFDEDPDIRRPILDYWISLDYVTVINKTDMESSLSSSSGARKQLFESLSGINTSKDGWRIQGIKMFKRKYYEQAMKCFEHSKDEKLMLRAQAYMEASKGNELQSEKEALKYQLSNSQLNKDEKEKMNEKINAIEKKMCESFSIAAKIFDSLSLLTQASQCYFSMGNYQKAADCFESLNLLSQAGEAYFKMGNYLRAGELYEKGNVPSNAIIAYEKVEQWEKILQCIHKFKSELAEDHRIKLVKKYIQLGLKAMFEEFERANEEVVKEEIKEKNLPALQSSSALASSNGPQYEVIDDDEKKSQISQQSKRSYEIIDGGESNKSDRKSEYSVLSKGLESSSDAGSPAKENSTKMEEEKKKKSPCVDADHISSLDPEDEWIQCETGSIIDSIVSGKIDQSNKSSDFSMLENPHAFAVNCSVVKTRRDIFVEDQMMSKIIKYVSYFSEDVKLHLEKLRSKSVLVHKIQQDQIVAKSTAEFIVDMDEIDVDFVNLLLDILENLGLYKLCIIICNRYQINDRIGRYIVSIAHRYSNIKMICDAYSKYMLLTNNSFRQMQNNNALIANTALHSVFEVVNPACLKMKKFCDIIDSTNSLGLYCYRSLLFLGYWKKLVYIMDCDSSLTLTSTFADFQNYKMIYYMNFGPGIAKGQGSEIKSKILKCGFDWIQAKSENDLDKYSVKALILGLDAVLWEMNKLHGSITLKLSPQPNSSPVVPEFPTFFPCNTALWNCTFDPNEKQLKALEAALLEGAKVFLGCDKNAALSEIMTKKELIRNLAIVDFSTSVIYLLMGATKDGIFYKACNLMNSQVINTLYKCTFKIINLIYYEKTLRVFSPYYYLIYSSVLSCYGIRRMESSSLRFGFGSGYLMHNSSIFFEKAMQMAQSKKEEKSKQLEEKVTKDMPRFYSKEKGEFEQLFKEKLREEMEKEHNKMDSEFDIYLFDLEAEYLLLPPSVITKLIAEKLANQVEQITLSRAREIDTKCTKSMRIWDIFSIDSKAELLSEVYYTVMRLGEIAYTLKILSLFKNKEIKMKLKDPLAKKDILDYYIQAEMEMRIEDLKSLKIKKAKLGLGPKKIMKKKATPKSSYLTILKSQTILFFKLKFLSVMMMESLGKNTHLNADSFILQRILSYITTLRNESSQGFENELLPILSCYNSINKYIMLLTNLRALQITKHKWISNNHYNWVNAMVEIGANCMEDAFFHLTQYISDCRRELDPISKMIAVEKIVLLYLLLAKSHLKKPIIISSHLKKHLSNITSVENCSTISWFIPAKVDTKVLAEITSECKRVLEQTAEDILNIFFPYLKKFACETMQVLLLTLLANSESNSESKVYSKIALDILAQENTLILKDFFVNKGKVEIYRDILKACSIEPDNFSFDWKMEELKIVHNSDLKPNIGKLEKDSLTETKEMVRYVNISKKMRNRSINRNLIKLKRTPFSTMKYEISLELINRNMVALSDSLVRFWEGKQSSYYLQFMQKIRDTQVIVANTFYKTPIFDVLDAHYLFTLLDQVDGFFNQTLKLISKSIEFDKDDAMSPPREEDKQMKLNKKPQLNDKGITQMRGEIDKLLEELKVWKNNKFMPDEVYIEKKKVIYRSSWQSYRRKLNQQKMAKRTGIKRQEMLSRKRDMLKAKDRDKLAINI